VCVRAEGGAYARDLNVEHLSTRGISLAAISE
jgi:hypothetical protein